MTKSTLNQFDYARLFLTDAGIDEQNNSIDIGSFWWNTVDLNHLRLSLSGITFIKKQTKLPIYTINISHPLLSRHLIKLSRIRIGPYYLHQTHNKTTIVLLDQESATMMTLHAGNLGQYLDNLQE